MNNEEQVLDFGNGAKARARDFMRQEVLGSLIAASDDFDFWGQRAPFNGKSKRFSDYDFSEPIDEPLEQFIDDLEREIGVDDFNEFNFKMSLDSLTSSHGPRRGRAKGIQYFEGTEAEFLKAFFRNLHDAHYPLLGFLASLFEEASLIIKDRESFQAIHQNREQDKNEEMSERWTHAAVLNAPVTCVLEGIACGANIDKLLSESFELFEKLLALLESIKLDEEQLSTTIYDPVDFSHEEIITALREAFDELTVMIHLEL